MRRGTQKASRALESRAGGACLVLCVSWVVREGLSDALKLNPDRGEKAEHIKIWEEHSRQREEEGQNP